MDDENGNSHLTLFIQNGCWSNRRLPLRTGLREIAKIHDGDFRLTANQNLIIANVPRPSAPGSSRCSPNTTGQLPDQSGLRLNSLACVALPTCGLALAEAQRYLPDLLTELEECSASLACGTTRSPSA
ncbi:MAG: hypothetical protein CM1200mP34_4300 [Verrucomicrobiales bacterium]|nr:MAG: hypothetical protein CM1200mP34_4300 [Verrucomicrobiales bacterium]